MQLMWLLYIMAKGTGKNAISSFAVINALCRQHVSSYITALHTLKDDNYHTHMLAQQ